MRQFKVRDPDGMRGHQVRPHSARLNGAQDGALDAGYPCPVDPIRLVRMVKKIVPHRSTFGELVHHPGEPDEVQAFLFAGY